MKQFRACVQLASAYSVLAISLQGGDAALRAILSSPAVAPGGTAQVTLTLPAPVTLVTGTVSIDFDPGVFDNISAINVFSANGDQAGVANIQGRHADVQFVSSSGGIGRLPNYPVLQVTVPVLATASPGASGAVTAQSGAAWSDLSGNNYSLSFESNGVLIGAGPSIQSVAPGGSPVPPGTRVQINGQGFNTTSKLRLDGVAWSNLKFVSSSVLTFTLTAPADLTGKLLTLTNAGGTKARYYSSFTPASIRSTPSLPASLQPIFSQSTLAGTFIDQTFALENQTPNSVDVVFESFGAAMGPGGEQDVFTKTITLAAGEVYMGGIEDLPGNWAYVYSAAPIRALTLYDAKISGIPIMVTLPPPLVAFPFGMTVIPDGPLNWSVRPSDPPPPPIALKIYDGPSGNLAVTAGTDDGNPWLFASVIPGQINVSVNQTGLALGGHNGVISITPKGALTPSRQIDVRLYVTPYALIKGGGYLTWSGNGSDSDYIPIWSDSGAVPFTASSSVDWFSVTPTNAKTPTTLKFSVDQSKAAGQSNNGVITVRGPSNTLTIPFSALLNFGPVDPNPLTFSLEAGSAQPGTQIVSVAGQPFTFDIATESGGPWLSAAITDGAGVPGLAVSAGASSLAAGTYQGTITIHPMPAIGSTEPISLAVTLFVWAYPTPTPEASPSSLQLSDVFYDLSTFSVSSGAIPLPFSVKAETDNGTSWLGLTSFQTLTPALVWININPAEALPNGVYHGRVTITAPPGSTNTLVVPVTLTVNFAPLAQLQVPPLISSLVNAASLLPGPISPGEIVSLFGTIGPDVKSGLHVGRDGKVSTSSYANRVLFNGVPAPLTYVSSTQINTVVPYEVAESSVATVELDMSGIHSPPWGVPVAQSAPGLFTQTGSGYGAASILNQDNSLNTRANPAQRGTLIQIFATGEGQTNPPGITGEITETDTKNPLLKTSVQMCEENAYISSATTAPDAIAGLFQINAQVPPNCPVGDVPVIISIGSVASQATATVSVR